jgi:hypothetical protein
VSEDRPPDVPTRAGTSDDTPWQQRALDNIWLLIAISVIVPGLLYLGWGLWELAELPTWGGR